MADRSAPHVDVAGWLLGDLEPAEYADTRVHLTTCDECRALADDLRATADLALLRGPAPRPPADLQDRIVAAIAAEADPTPAALPRGMSVEDVVRGRVADDVEPSDLDAPDAWSPHAVADPATTSGARPSGRRDQPRPQERRRGPRDLPRWVRPLATAAVVVIAFGAVVVGIRPDGTPGVVEVDTQLVAAAGDASSADIVVRRLGSGRAVDLTSDTLPILPDGGLYELWFVGPGDTPESPNRVSAGTFHPDEDGVTDVLLHAAVVPDEYPTVVITAEPKNGDPDVNGPEVVRSAG